MTARREVAAALALTFVSGCLDAVSFLGLGEVFVANMTGNVALVGFAVTGEDLDQGARAGLALGGFVLGALLAGRLTRPLEPGRAWSGRLSALVAVEAVLLGAVAVLLVVTGGGSTERDTERVASVVVLSVAMGVQGTVARRMAVSDVPTTVITSTLTGLVMDSRLAGGPRTRSLRRLGAVLALGAGAALGALLAVLVSLAAAAGLAAGVALAVLVHGLLRQRQPVQEGAAGRLRP